MSRSRSRSLTLALATAPLIALAGCGSGGGSSGDKSVAGVGSCLQSAGFGVTVVPTSQLATDGPENRGPGQTGELLAARQGVKPTIGSDNADVVVAFWRSASLAKSSPNARAKGLGMHADAIGSTTVQATAHLAQYALTAAKTASGRQAAFQAQIKKAEGCVS